jgi:hypothetical protein
MRLAKMMTAVAACSLAVSPAIASSASKLSLSGSSAVRASTAAGQSNEAAGGFIIPLLAVAAIVLGVVVAVDGDDEPDSN